MDKSLDPNSPLRIYWYVLGPPASKACLENAKYQPHKQKHTGTEEFDLEEILLRIGESNY